MYRHPYAPMDTKDKQLKFCNSVCVEFKGPEIKLDPLGAGKYPSNLMDENGHGDEVEGDRVQYAWIAEFKTLGAEIKTPGSVKRIQCSILRTGMLPDLGDSRPSQETRQKNTVGFNLYKNPDFWADFLSTERDAKGIPRTIEIPAVEGKDDIKYKCIRLRD